MLEIVAAVMVGAVLSYENDFVAVTRLLFFVIRAVTVPVVPVVSPDTVVLAVVPSLPNDVYEPLFTAYSHLLIVCPAASERVAVVAALSFRELPLLLKVGAVLSAVTLVDAVTPLYVLVTRTYIV
jgi:hypothetical protein